MGTDGTSYEVRIDAPHENADAAASALDRLSSELERAGSAAEKAAGDVKDGEAAYSAAERAADKAAKAVERIGVQAEAQRGKLAKALEVGDIKGAARAEAALARLADREREAKRAASLARDALNKEAAALDTLQKKADKAAAEHKGLVDRMEATEKAAKEVAEATEKAAGTGDVGKLSSALGKLGGPLGETGSKAFEAAEAVQELIEAAGVAGPIIALSVALAAITAGAIAATAAITALSIKMADAGRSTKLLNDGIAGSVEGGQQLTDKINALSKRLPHTRAELQEMAADLAKSGKKGRELTEALEDSATEAARLKWGPDFAKQTRSLDKLASRFGDNLGDVFGSLEIEPLLKGLEKLVDLFDANSVTGRAMGVVFRDLFQKVVDASERFIPKLIGAFIQLQIWILKALILIKPYGSKIRELASIVGGALTAGIVGFGAALAVVTGVLVAVVAVVSAFISGLVKMWKTVVETGKAIVSFAENLSLVELGGNMIDGLIAGITGGATRVVDAMTGVVGGAVNAAKKALGIASPSKVFAAIGTNTTESMADSVEDGTDKVQSAYASMASPSDEVVSASASGGPGPGTGGGGITISGNTFQFYGVEGAEDAESKFRALLTRVLEGDVAALGGGESLA